MMIIRNSNNNKNNSKKNKSRNSTNKSSDNSSNSTNKNSDNSSYSTNNSSDNSSNIAFLGATASCVHPVGMLLGNSMIQQQAESKSGLLLRNLNEVTMMGIYSK